MHEDSIIAHGIDVKYRNFHRKFPVDYPGQDIKYKKLKVVSKFYIQTDQESNQS